jgi:hypothetical protein
MIIRGFSDFLLVGDFLRQKFNDEIEKRNRRNVTICKCVLLNWVRLSPMAGEVLCLKKMVRVEFPDS